MGRLIYILKNVDLHNSEAMHELKVVWSDHNWYCKHFKLCHDFTLIHCCYMYIFKSGSSCEKNLLTFLCEIVNQMNKIILHNVLYTLLQSCVFFAKNYVKSNKFQICSISFLQFSESRIRIIRCFVLITTNNLIDSDFLVSSQRHRLWFDENINPTAVNHDRFQYYQHLISTLDQEWMWNKLMSILEKCSNILEN